MQIKQCRLCPANWGELATSALCVNACADGWQWRWPQAMKRREIMVHSILHHDIMRRLIGKLSPVYAIVGCVTGQLVLGETARQCSFSLGLPPINHFECAGLAARD
ncbi:hypothetical protein GCM10009655_04190 [Rhodoglobus aureus]|uniref:Uncharacterized protein n=1 Tax=Rhodoglobus aureus TaxID=191497 RepID=A0ABN1VEP9_9MICO